MIIIWGTRLYGTVDRCGSTRIATKFFHVYGLPLIPLGSVLVTEESPDGKTYRGVPLGIDPRSLLAAYGRMWLPVAAVATGVAAWGGWNAFRVDVGDAIMSTIFFAAAAVLALHFWVRLGKLSGDARAQRLVYADYTGIPADVARLGDAREPLREKLLGAVSERSAALAATGYRIGLEPGSGWDKVALDPAVRDRDFLAASLTLARLEWSQARGPQKAEADSRHRKIWERLKEVDPLVMSNAAAI